MSRCAYGPERATLVGEGEAVCEQHVFGPARAEYRPIPKNRDGVWFFLLSTTNVFTLWLGWYIGSGRI